MTDQSELAALIDDVRGKIGNVNTNDEVTEIDQQLQQVQNRVRGVPSGVYPEHIPEGQGRLVKETIEKGYVENIHVQVSHEPVRGIGKVQPSVVSGEFVVTVEIIARFTESEYYGDDGG